MSAHPFYLSSLKALVSMQKSIERVVPSHLFALVKGHGVIRRCVAFIPRSHRVGS